MTRMPLHEIERDEVGPTEEQAGEFARSLGELEQASETWLRNVLRAVPDQQDARRLSIARTQWELGFGMAWRALRRERGGLGG